MEETCPLVFRNYYKDFFIFIFSCYVTIELISSILSVVVPIWKNRKSANTFYTIMSEVYAITKKENTDDIVTGVYEILDKYINSKN